MDAKVKMLYWLANPAARKRSMRRYWGELLRANPADYAPGELAQLRACTFLGLAGDRVNGRG